MKLDEIVEFKPGQREETVTLAIIDDAKKPTFEGNEIVQLLLKEPVDLTISEPEKLLVTITDEEDSMFSL